MTPRRADLLLLAATVVWGTSFVVVKDALATATPLAFVTLRFGIAALILTPFAGLRQPFTRDELAAGLLLTALIAAGFATQTVGLVYTTPARSAFIVAMSSVVAPVVALVVLRERSRPWVLAALGVAAGGVYLLTAPDAGGLNRGDLWTIVTAVVFGAQIVAVAELAKRYAPRRLLWLQLVGTTLVVGAAIPFLETPHISWTPRFVTALLYAAVCATVIVFLWQMHAQRHMSSTRAALLFCFEPVVAALASWLWVGEVLTATQWAGGGLIVAGMMLADLPARRPL